MKYNGFYYFMFKGSIRSYLITALYNAPVTMSSFYRAEVNYDMFGKR